MRLAGHPLHPMLAHFPVASWTVAIGADIGGLLAGDPWWWQVGSGCQALGVLAGAAAMVAGSLDYAALPRSHPAQDTAIAHMLAMCTAWLSFAVSLGLRGPPDAVAPPLAAIVAAGFGFVVMSVGGWLGGRLVYRFAVGVAGGGQPSPRAAVDAAPFRDT